MKKRSIDSILKNFTWGRTEKDLRKDANVLISAANKRIKSAKKDKFGLSPSLSKQLEKRDKFSIKGTDYNQLESELKDVISFLRAKTSTKAGREENRLRKTIQLGLLPWLTLTGRMKKGKSLEKAMKGKTKKELLQGLSESKFIEAKKEEARKIYEMLDKIREFDKGLYTSMYFKNVNELTEITKEMKKNPNIGFNEMYSKLQKIYEEKAERYNEDEREAREGFRK